MRIIVMSLLACAVACTKPNPNVCCVTDAQCAELGADELRPCAVGQACAPDFTCVAAQCETSADCTSPDAPICANNLCIGLCTSDDDCAGVAGRPYCSADQTCVGCLDASQCPANAAICDAEEQTCRGCERDDECASGVCIEADGDSGTCTRASPCRTVNYGISQATNERTVIRLMGGQFLPETINVNKRVVIDGNDTILPRPVDANLMELSAGTETITLEGVVLRSDSHSAYRSLRVGAETTVRISVGAVIEGNIELSNARLSVQKAQLGGGQTLCSAGSINIVDSESRSMAMQATNCQVAVSRTRLSSENGGILSVEGGLATIENNLFVQGYEYADSLSFRGLAPGSHFRFNTVVNVSGIAADGVAIACDETIDVTSNVFAYNSAHPAGPPGGLPCTTRYSLFDDVAVESHRSGVGNVFTLYASMFVDADQGEYHLAAGNPGANAAELGLGVTNDLLGQPRTEMPDMGAFEAP